MTKEEKAKEIIQFYSEQMEALEPEIQERLVKNNAVRMQIEFLVKMLEESRSEMSELRKRMDLLATGLQTELDNLENDANVSDL